MWFIPQIVPGGPIGLPGVVFPGSSCTEKIGGYGNCVEFLLYLCRCRCHDLKDAEGPSGVEDAWLVILVAGVTCYGRRNLEGVKRTA